MNIWLTPKVQEISEDKVLTFLCLTRGKKKTYSSKGEGQAGLVKKNSNFRALSPEACLRDMLELCSKLIGKGRGIVGSWVKEKGGRKAWHSRK